jgi:FkbM family methyltransferase
MMFKSELEVTSEFHGTEYGGFAILKKSLNKDSVILSCGIGEDASFDMALIEKYGCVIHAFDPTPKSIAWVKATISDPHFVFHEYAVADTDGSIRLYLPKRADYVSASLQPGWHTSDDFVDVVSRRLSTIVKELGLDKIDVLKMDIEGAEYIVLQDYLTDPDNPLPDQLALEFHHFYPEFGLQATKEAINLIKSRGYRLCWVSRSHHELLFVRSHLLKAQLTN